MIHKISALAKAALAVVLSLSASSCAQRAPVSTDTAFGTSALVEEIRLPNGSAMTFAYNPGGRLLNVEVVDAYNKFAPARFEYGKGKIEGFTYDVAFLNVANDLYPYTLDIYFAVGAMGFADEAWEVRTHQNGEKEIIAWTFSYTPDGKLAAFTSDGDDIQRSATLQWYAGDLSWIQCQQIGHGEIVNYKTIFHYESSDIKEELDNLGNVNLLGAPFDNIMPVEMSTAFYAGLLGGASLHLPVMELQGPIYSPQRIVYQWKFNQDGYPVYVERSTADAGKSTTYFNWVGMAHYTDPLRAEAESGIEKMYEDALRELPHVKAKVLMQEYMAPSLRHALEAADKKSAINADIWLDYIPWVDGQEFTDPVLKRVEILSCEGDVAKARVVVEPFNNSDFTKHITILAVKDAGRWWVSDFYGDDGVSLKNRARSYLLE